MLYVAGDVSTAVGEVFGDYPEAQICPNQRIAIVRPTDPIPVLDLKGKGAAMRIGALPSLLTAPYPRPVTQEWARAIYEDQPVRGTHVWGVYYETAHTAGRSLALWDTSDRIEVVPAYAGQQDFALVDDHVWPRIQQAVVSQGGWTSRVARCNRCP